MKDLALILFGICIIVALAETTIELTWKTGLAFVVLLSLLGGTTNATN